MGVRAGRERDTAVVILPPPPFAPLLHHTHRPGGLQNKVAYGIPSCEVGHANWPGRDGRFHPKLLFSSSFFVYRYDFFLWWWHFLVALHLGQKFLQ